MRIVWCVVSEYYQEIYYDRMKMCIGRDSQSKNLNSIPKSSAPLLFRSDSIELNKVTSHPQIRAENLHRQRQAPPHQSIPDDNPQLIASHFKLKLPSPNPAITPITVVTT